MKYDTLYSNTGVPQATVLAPLLFSLYMSDCRSSNESCSIAKFADDTVLIGKISDDDSNICTFATYCKINVLDIDVEKKKEMIVDFRKSKALPDPIIINDHTVERVSTYEYLGAMLNNDHSLSSNTDYILSKLNSRLYCLRRPKKFYANICIIEFFISWLSKMLSDIVVFVGVEALRSGT